MENIKFHCSINFIDDCNYCNTVIYQCKNVKKKSYIYIMKTYLSKHIIQIPISNFEYHIFEIFIQYNNRRNIF